MRSLVILLSFVFMATLSLSVPEISLSFDWHYYILGGGAYGGGFIKLDSDDLPHIMTYAYGLLHAFYNGYEWEYETIAGSELFGRACIVLDEQDKIYMACYHMYDDDLYYCYNDGSDWIFELVDAEDDSGGYNSLALDSNGFPHIAYEHRIWTGNGSSDLRYAYKDADGWHIQVVDDESQLQGSPCSLALDSQEHAHISYHKKHPTESYWYTSYAHWDGTQWLIEPVGDIGSVEWNSIAVDSLDQPHIALCGGSGLTYAIKDGSEWVIDVVDNCDGDVSILLDNQEYPTIAYCCYENYTDVIKYAHWNGSEWEIEIACDPGTSEFLLGQLNVFHDLDSEDKPHIVCDESPHSDVYYIWYGDPLTEVTLEQFSAHAEGSAIAINWTVETTPPMAGGDQILGFNLYRRPLTKEGDDTYHRLTASEDQLWERVNSTLITGENPFSYTDSDVESGVAYEYKLEAVLADDNPETLGTTQATAGLPPASFAILAIYPNPASDYLTCLLALPSAGVVELRLYDLSGRLVLNQQLEATEPTELEAMFDVSMLASGVYTLRASYYGAEVSARAVIAR